jgi:hypothetical protein
MSAPGELGQRAVLDEIAKVVGIQLARAERAMPKTVAIEVKY